MDLSGDDVQHRAEADRREIDHRLRSRRPRSPKPAGWMKERQECWCRVRGADSVNGGSEMWIFLPPRKTDIVSVPTIRRCLGPRLKANSSVAQRDLKVIDRSGSGEGRSRPAGDRRSGWRHGATPAGGQKCQMRKASSGQDGRQDRERWNQLPPATPEADPAVRLGRVLPVGTHRGHGVGVEPPREVGHLPRLGHITDLAPFPTHLPGHDSLLPLATVDSSIPNRGATWITCGHQTQDMSGAVETDWPTGRLSDPLVEHFPPNRSSRTLTTSSWRGFRRAHHRSGRVF